MEREAEMTEWNDGRLDELSKKVDDGFAKVDRRFEQVDQRFKHMEGKMEAGFARIDAKFEALHRMLFQAAWALVVALVTLVGVLIF